LQDDNENLLFQIKLNTLLSISYTIEFANCGSPEKVYILKISILGYEQDQSLGQTHILDSGNFCKYFSSGIIQFPGSSFPDIRDFKPQGLVWMNVNQNLWQRIRDNRDAISVR
jgi:hypothetical protein